MVGAAGIEPATTCSQSRYATAALRPEGVELSHVGAGAPRFPAVPNLLACFPHMFW